ncbi:exonuclease mut-7 homolog isoform X4 [Macaca thibetana thibetana]|uniref:exonuclease mut-7 homolog isoform X4 n=1 Tax=Macaca thibetana thibetana TaxID=257877 RepID=UPI0021BCE12B|nr:exonuclease mut-7 homolog isoform X4 [Macaca thibetana thibetana]
MDPGDPTGDPATGERRCTGQDPLLLLQALQTLWSTRERQQLQEEAWRGFAALDDPLAGLLDMLESCRGRRGEGPSLEAWISRQLQCWLQAQPRPSPAQHSLRLKQLQARAIRVLTESPPSLVAPLTSIFQLQDADRSCLLVHVHRLHQEGRFREAVMLGTTLKLQPELDVEKMSVPLLLQDKVALVERYVAGFPDLQRRLLALMDSWCQPGFDIKDVARQYPEVTSLSLEKLSPKVLSRQVLRLQERYGVAPALCPNAAMWQRLAALRHLCHKRFVEKSLSQENWADHVQGLVGQSPWLQEQLSQLLVSHGDPVTAARCAMGLSLPEERLPAAVAVELRQLSLQGRAAEADSRLEVKDVKDRYYQLPIPRENIHLLASWEDLTRYEGALLQPHQVVGVDLEWTPVFVAGGRPRPSLLQVAVEGRVFLLDVLALSQPPTGQGAQAFSRLVAQLLSDPSITKLGYGMVGDLQKLGASCPALAHVEKQILGGVDLLLVHRQMRVANMPTSGTDRAKGLRGLSLLVQQVLGTALDKTQQLSNWDRRPLCEEQLIYAAADAYCLLEVHKALCREPARFHLSEDLAGSRRPRHTERPGAQKPPGLQKASASAAPRQVARQEGRIILTSGQPFHKLRAQVGAGRCFSVDCSLKAQQQAKAVLKHFNVRVTHADIFSRCQACNCDQYLKVSRDMMKQLMWLSSHQEGPRSSGDKTTLSQEVQEPGPGPEAAPGGCTYDRPCRWLQAADLRAETPDMLTNGTRLQLAGVPVGVLRTPGLRHFYCCTRCGKVFWDGSHLDRVATHFRDVLESAPSPREPSPAPSPASSPF